MWKRSVCGLPIRGDSATKTARGALQTGAPRAAPDVTRKGLYGFRRSHFRVYIIIFFITATPIFILLYLAHYLLLYMLRNQLYYYWEEDKQYKKRISYKSSLFNYR